jgi:hypothetical protein
MPNPTGSVVMPAPASTSNNVDAMRARYDRALAAASRADIGTRAPVTRWHAETLLSMDGQPGTGGPRCYRDAAALGDHVRSWSTGADGPRRSGA